MSAGMSFCKKGWLVSVGFSLVAISTSRADTPPAGHADAPVAAVTAPAAASAPAAATTAATAPAAAPAGAALQGDATRGKALYQNCTACHSIDDDDIGPRHRGVVGRKAGSVPGYPYSAALKASGIVWDKDTLDRWLTNPSAMVPGTKMFFLIKDPQSRADIIAYLAELH